jgi:ergothioneine biosynthesis protein EgtB
MLAPVLKKRFAEVRSRTAALAAGLSEADQTAQSMPETSPTKWHLAHTTWFFEEFLLKAFVPDYRPFHPQYAFLFNSYYVQAGARFPRPKRGVITRPGVAEILDYRAYVERALCETRLPEEASFLIELGCQHEEQHQELIQTDILHLFAQNPLYPAAYPHFRPPPVKHAEGFAAFAGGLIEIGARGNGFAFDNELPRHTVWLGPYELARGLITNAQWCAFIEDGGYETPTLWLSDGWAWVVSEAIKAPLYWRRDGDTWLQIGLGGLEPLVSEEPVRHVSFFEAEAFARWQDARLPTEAEWEYALASTEALPDAFGQVWQWTASPYQPYPGFRPAAGAVGEYNGKFMNNQYVLRGSSMVTPPGHSRVTYRNFFHPDERWQFTGLRLARDV